METRVDEVAEDIFRLSVLVPEIAPPAGFTFNHYLVRADEPLLFHCGSRRMFADLSAAAATVAPVQSLRWISFGHVESDECGSMNAWLAAAPRAQVVHGRLGCEVSLNDMADRPPRAMGDGETIDLGGKRVRWIDTPHVPHAWEAGLMFEETTATLFCGDLFTQAGDGPPISGADPVPGSIRTEEAFGFTSLTAATAPTIRALKALRPQRLALMHGSCFEGDCDAALDGLADYFEVKLRAAINTVN